MIKESFIRKLAEEKIKDLAEREYFLVNVSVSSSNAIRVEIDGDKGVKISDCVEISRHIEKQFDRDEEDFELTVSSAGMDQPFKILRQYQRYLGREVQLTTTDGHRHKAKLMAADETEVLLEQVSREKVEGKKKKQLVTREIRVPMEQVKETKVVISFK
ncbi:MAG: ribosome assembly cofactor RimP [Vicingaceae bacterium]